MECKKLTYRNKLSVLRGGLAEWQNLNTDKDPGPPICDDVFCGTGGDINSGTLPENDIYFFHPDHLGSTSYITNISGETVQFNSYMPFGETFVSQRRTTTISAYLFNGKEQDPETGLYYYGARYYNPKISNWLSVDPIALYNPIDEVEHYLDGQHNGGYFNPRNMSVYGYTYQNPIKYVDPNGKQAFFMHGTFTSNFGMSKGNMNKIQKLFGNSASYKLQLKNPTTRENIRLQNNHAHRKMFADKLTKAIIKSHKEGEDITLVGHSHGGSINIMIANNLNKHFNGKVKINLLTLSTPNRSDYQLGKTDNVNHYHVFNYSDMVQGSAHIDSDKRVYSHFRQYKGWGFGDEANANIEYNDNIFNSGGHSSYSDKNFNQWFPKLEKQVQNENKKE